MPPRESGGTSSSTHVITLLTLVGSPIALVTALMFYFGWVRSQAQAVAFRTDISVFEMSPQDLVLRSVSILFFPILGLLLAGLLALRLHPWLRSHARHVSPVLRFSWVLVLVGVLLLILAEPIGRILLPLWAFLGIGGTAYGVWLQPRIKGDPAPSSVARVALVVSLLVVTLFWLTERLAQVAGDALADDLQQNLALRLPAVTLISAVQLNIEGVGVTEIPSSGPGGTGYRYEGLYLMQRSGTKYFFVTDGWRDNQGRLFVVPDSEAIRLEFGQHRP
jgi:hypothetical protein